jgi:hypothetical protein
VIVSGSAGCNTFGGTVTAPNALCPHERFLVAVLVLLTALAAGVTYLFWLRAARDNATDLAGRAMGLARVGGGP